jgi:hypothetical protein
MSTLTDLEMTRLCADALGIDRALAYCDGYCRPGTFDPLHHDAHAMALVKRFDLEIRPPYTQANMDWSVRHFKTRSRNLDLNRAIVECVASMQAAKGK